MSAPAALTWDRGGDEGPAGFLPDGYDPDSFVRTFDVRVLCRLISARFEPEAGREAGPTHHEVAERRRRYLATRQRPEVERVSPADQRRRAEAMDANLHELLLARLRRRPTPFEARERAWWEALVAERAAEARRAALAEQLRIIEQMQANRIPGQLSQVDRASRWLARVDSAVDGQGWDNTLRRAAFGLVVKFALPGAVAFELLTREYAPRCQPRPSAYELRRKVRGCEGARATRGDLQEARRA